MTDRRKTKALDRARAIYMRHVRRCEDADIIPLLGSGMDARTIEDQLIEAIAIAIFDAATTGAL